MAKKIMGMLLVLTCMIFTAWAAVYVKKSGLFKPYPDKEYLTAEEEAERPIYRQLSGDEKTLYTAVYRGAQKHEEEIPLPFDADGESYSRIYCLIEKQESGLFWLDSTYYTAQKLRDASVVYRTADNSEREKMETDLEKAVKAALSNMNKDVGEFEAALYIHDYIINKCRYTTTGLNTYGATVYGCLVDGEAHCEGYAKAFQYLCAEVGLECVVVTGVTSDGENHAWNQVKIDGEWYNVDVTWDDLDAETAGRHLYFMCNDEFMSESHTAEIAYFMPFECTSEGDWFKRSGLYIETIENAETIMRREIFNGNKAVELKFGDKKIYSEFKNEFLEGEKLFDIIMESGEPISETGISVTLREDEESLYMTVVIS